MKSTQSWSDQVFSFWWVITWSSGLLGVWQQPKSPATLVKFPSNSIASTRTNASRTLARHCRQKMELNILHTNTERKLMVLIWWIDNQVAAFTPSLSHQQPHSSGPSRQPETEGMAGVSKEETQSSRLESATTDTSVISAAATGWESKVILLNQFLKM